MVRLIFPTPRALRGHHYWLRVSRLLASRRRYLRADHSNEWRYAHERASPPAPDRSVLFTRLLGGAIGRHGFRFVILGDTGEGDRSQYSLLPLIRAIEPHFMIINGDVAYPAGSYEDFRIGFFEPYAGLGIPIWATAGNHEYYSKHHGREFHEIFCTERAAALWSAAGLRLVAQPGMYWELRDPDGKTPLVVIGLDSGTKGNLDGHEGFLARINPFGRAMAADPAQHEWLEWRLGVADDRDDRVLVLYHIPGLVSRRHDGHTHLGELHRILLRHRSVAAVVCSHTHNHQEYEPQAFAAYAARQHGAARPSHDPPHYLVSGNGGATLDPTDFPKGGYEEKDVYPSVRQWREYATTAERFFARLGAHRLTLARLAVKISRGAATDIDPAGLQSFLLVDVPIGRPPRVSRVAVDDLQDIFQQHPDDTRIDVGAADPPLDPNALERCTRHLFDL